MKTYKLKTIKDILEVVTEDNLENFMVDLMAFLSMRIEFNKLETLKGVIKMDDSCFQWIDDGKHNATYKFKVKK